MQIDFYNPRSIILFICILQGLIFAGLLVVRGFRRKKRADFWLAILLVLPCLSLVTPFIGFANVYDLNQWLTYFPFGIAYGYGVCVYFYVLSLTDSKRRFTPQDFLFFIPAILYLIFRFALFAQNLEFKNRFNENYYVPIAAPLIFVTEFVWNIIFLYFSIKHYKKYRAWLDENFSDTEKIKFDWVGNFLYVFTFVLVSGAIFDFTDSFIFNLSYIQYFYFELIMAFTTYYLAIAGYLHSEAIELGFTETESRRAEPRKTLLSENDLQLLKTKLQNLMEKEKPFLDSQLTLSNLAKQIGVNTTALSFVINNGFGKNFNDFVNRVPDSLSKYLSTWDKTFKQPKNEAGFVKNEIGLYEKKQTNASDVINPNPHGFTGRVYLLTNAVNSSSTFDMAWTFQANKLGVIVGEPTGGTKRGLNGGQMFFLTLPNSKFEIDLPIVHYYHKGFPDEGVMPDYVVETTREAIQNDQDRQLSFTLKMLVK